MDTDFFQKTPIQDLVIYQPRIHRDARGYFVESFNEKHFHQAGIPCDFVQDNRSYSTKGTLRGLHLQLGEHAQSKLVGVLSGQVFDVAVDLRQGSPTFGKHYSIHLDATQDPLFFYVPRGFAHGFLVLSETAEFYYKVDNFYHRDSECGIIFDDPTLAIEWPKVDVPLNLSDKDKKLPNFETFVAEYGGRVL